MDLTLKRIETWTSPGVIDLDNSQRVKATTTHRRYLKGHHRPEYSTSQAETRSSPSSFRPDEADEQDGGILEIVLFSSGSYLVEFNESVDVPLDLMGQIFVRSSLFRLEALLSAGVMDSGYKGGVGAMLQVLRSAWLDRVSRYQSRTDGLPPDE